MNLTPGSTFGTYQIIEQIGRGGMASVFKAYESSLDRYIALKVLPPEFLHDETFAARFQREAKVVAKLEHPNIIPIFSFGIEGGTPWMAMRLISGGSLSAVLNKGPFGLERSVAVIRAVADALSYAHAEGVVHRDVKPQNILLDQQGRVYLADFGIARMVEGGAAITRTGLVSGTPQYMAPEQATGHALDHRMDIYALGIVAYEMFTGSTPFSADTPVAVLIKHVSAPIPIPPKEDVPEELLGPLIRSLAKNPDERWQTADDFASAIERGLGLVATAVASVPPTAILAPTQRLSAEPPPPPREGAVAPPRRAGAGAFALWLGIGFALLMAAGGAVVFWAWQHPSAPPDPPIVASPASAPDVTLAAPAPSPEAAVIAEGTTARPSPSSAVPPAPVPPSTSPSAPRAARATPETRTTPVPAQATSTTVTTTLTAEPPPASATTLPPPPASARPPGHPFRVGEKIDVGAPQVGPVILLGVSFKATRPDELEVQLEFQCVKGKDQMVTYEVVILDGAGALLLSVKGKKGVEEKEHATFKPKQRVDPRLFETARSFRVTFSSVPD